MYALFVILKHVLRNIVYCNYFLEDDIINQLKILHVRTKYKNEHS